MDIYYVYIYIYIYIYGCLCMSTHTHTCTHNWNFIEKTIRTHSKLVVFNKHFCREGGMVSERKQKELQSQHLEESFIVLGTE